ncbi:hypothetical protein [Desulfosporosinus hippei]|uniref:Uncharacterized protein n=1 Tax=Desulfosporosinus hippei DSM 8344 TaxID=1121419 RepID=A0A1G8KR25_9FIRM|nr:hypothetical protein [Desulfosporosinus hippei]SDI45931.1 hypothetical protein SAMN05443529_14021 [Desulfosporosinus hippei DSM 8344]
MKNIFNKIRHWSSKGKIYEQACISQFKQIINEVRIKTLCDIPENEWNSYVGVKLLKVKQLAVIFAILLMLNTFLGTVSASWVSFTPQQLVQDSDVILIGEISGPTGEKLGILERFRTSGYTHWKVNVRYYLKGDKESHEFIVATPGAQSSSVKSSIDYRLDEWGKTVLLFLRKSEDNYQPITPKGVVILNTTQYQRQPDDQLSGQLIQKEFCINDNRISQQEKIEFEKYIVGSSLVVLPTTAEQILGGSWFWSNHQTFIAVSIVLILIVSLIIFFRKRLIK